MKWYKVLIHVLFYISSTKNYHFSRAAPPPLSCYVKGLPLTAKSFWNTATYQKLWRGVPSTPPPPSPFVAPRGYEFACTSAGQCILFELVFFIYLSIALPSGSVCRLFMVLHTSCFYRSRNLQLRPRLQVSVFVWKRSFFPLWFRLSFTCNQWRRPRKTRLFKTAVQSGDFWKSRFVALVWMEWKRRGFWEGFRQDFGYHGQLMRILPPKSHYI